MAELTDFSLRWQLFLRGYRWRRIDPVPWTPLRKPLSDCRVGLVTSAGFSLPDQEPFDETVPGGDVSFRVIPADADVRKLVNSQRSAAFDHRGMLEDPNLAFPLDRLRDLVARGRLGSLAPSALSFMGSITAPGRLIQRTAPEAAALLVDERADIALLVPV
jgi:D-proline reductase (dithiol) PrdB